MIALAGTMLSTVAANAAAKETLGKEISFVARKDYNWGPGKSAHQGPAYLDGIKLVVTPEDSVRIGALLSGQGDAIRQVQAYDEKQVVDQGFHVLAASTRGVNNSITFRPDNALVADLRVREALLHGTDRQEIVESLYSANYPQAKSVIASTAQGFVDNSSKLAFDPAAAAKLLDTAGWTRAGNGLRQKDGKELVLTAYESPPQPQNKAMLELVAQQWARLGVKLRVLPGDAGTKTADDLDPAKTPVTPGMVGRADPDVIKSQYYPLNRDVLRQKGGQSGKVESFRDDQLNGLLEAIAAEVDPAKRLKLVGDVQAYLLDKAYVIPVFEEPQVYAAAPYVHGIGVEIGGRLLVADDGRIDRYGFRHVAQMRIAGEGNRRADECGEIARVGVHMGGRPIAAMRGAGDEIGKSSPLSRDCRIVGDEKSEPGENGIRAVQHLAVFIGDETGRDIDAPG